MRDDRRLNQLEEEIIAQFPTRFDKSFFEPRYLAPHFAVCMAQPAIFSELRTELHRRLLAFSVDEAKKRSAFFAEHLVDVDSNDILNNGVETVPFMRREHLELPHRSLTLSGLTFGFCSYTSGTTTGRPLLLYRSVEEQAYLREFIMTLYKTLNPDGRMVETEVSLMEANWAHGMQLQIPSPTHGIPVALEREGGFATAVRVLETPFPIEGRDRFVTAVSGSTLRLLQLTEYLTSHRHQTGLSNVKRVETGGRTPMPIERARLERAWGCEIGNVYSMTELFGSARYCSGCDAHHSDAYIHLEIVGYADGKPISEGRGRIAISGMFPFNQMTPILRYLPGDLAEVREVDCARGQLAVRLLGKDTRALGLERELGPNAFLSAAEVAEALEPLAMVHRPLDPAPVPTEIRRVGILPAFRLARDHAGVATIAIEQASESASEDAVALATNEVAAHLAARCPWLAPILDDGQIVLKWVPAGQFTDEVLVRP